MHPPVLGSQRALGACAHLLHWDTLRWHARRILLVPNHAQSWRAWARTHVRRTLRMRRASPGNGLARGPLHPFWSKSRVSESLGVGLSSGTSVKGLIHCMRRVRQSHEHQEQAWVGLLRASTLLNFERWSIRKVFKLTWRLFSDPLPRLGTASTLQRYAQVPQASHCHCLSRERCCPSGLRRDSERLAVATCVLQVDSIAATSGALGS